VRLARAGLQNWAILVYLKEMGFYGRISETEILNDVFYSTGFFPGKNILHLSVEYVERVRKQ
jgi:hypothetical protein